MIRIAHLLDDLSPGGVTRYVDFLIANAAPEEAHARVHLPRGRWSAPDIEADVIISHLTVRWRSLPMILSLRARHPAARIIHVEHSYCEGFCIGNDVPMGRFSALLRTAYAMFDSVVAVSEAQAAWMREREFVRDDKLSVIQPCVDLDPLLALPARPLRRPRRFALIGRLTRMKGFDLAIEGFRRSAPADAELNVFGDGPDRDALVEIAGDDPRIAFHPWTAPESAMEETEIVLMPSRWEPFGLVALEAFAAARGLICSTAEGLRGRGAVGAVYVDEDTPEAWAGAIAAATAEDFTIKAALGRSRAEIAARICLAAWRNQWGDGPEALAA